MIKELLKTTLLLISACAFGQTPLHSFQCQYAPGFQGFTPGQVDSFISKSNFETYRLLGRRDTLAFDNGFKVILLSADEMQQSGMMSNVSNYQVSYPAEYKMPVFHLMPNGWIMASYKPNIKSKGK